MAGTPGAGAPRSRGRIWIGVGVAGAFVLLVAAALLVNGSHSSTGAASSTSLAIPTSAPAPGYSPNASGSSGSGILIGGPTSALLALPPGATARTATGASPDGSLTLDQFLKQLYPTSTTERAALQRRGFVAAATRWFQTATGDYAAIWLIQFQAVPGAESYGLALGSAHRYNHHSDPTFTVPGLENGTGFEEAALDSDGNTRSFVYGSLGNVTVIVHFYAPASLDRAEMTTITNAQIARLKASEGPDTESPSPQPPQQTASTDTTA